MDRNRDIVFFSEFLTISSDRYDIANLLTPELVGPAFDTCVALTRLDDRIASSPVGAGFFERTQLPNSALWIDGPSPSLSVLAIAGHRLRAHASGVGNIGEP